MVLWVKQDLIKNEWGHKNPSELRVPVDPTGQKGKEYPTIQTV